jgi:hypothetical protein
MTDAPDSSAAHAVGGKSLALATILFVLFLTFLDNTIVTVVLANVQSGLHAAVNQLQWVVNGYAFTFAGLMLSFGTIGDLFGRKKVTLTGVGVFWAWWRPRCSPVAGGGMGPAHPDGHGLSDRRRRDPLDQRQHLSQCRHRADRLDHVPGRRRSRYGPGARHLGLPRIGAR